MKKIIKTLSLMLVLVIIFCSCGSNDFTYSSGLDENGFFEGVTAADSFTIGDVDNVQVASSKIDEEIKYLTETAYPTKTEVTEGTVTETSYVTIDFVGKIDGVEFENGSGEDKSLYINNNSYIDGFASGIVGHSLGETFDINVTFPDDYSTEDLAGKDAVFTITVKKLYTTSPAEFNDSFVSTNLYYTYYYYYGVSLQTADEFTEYLKESYAQSAVLDLLELKEDGIPDSVQEYTNNVTKLQFRDYAEKSLGVELVTYLKKYYSVSTYDEYLEENKDDLEDSAESALMVQALAEHYGIKVSEDDVKEYFDDDDEDTITYEEAVENYGLPYLKKYMLQDKVLEHVYEIVTFN